MKPIDPAELSAYLDGELSAARCRDIEAALAEQPALRREFDALSDSDRLWRAAADRAAFEPAMRLPSGSHARPLLRVAATAAILVALRILFTFSNAFLASFILYGIAFALVIVWVIRVSRVGSAARAHA